ncbi:hypothetical protein L1049_001567 [Liquidambar formosana]|uniref:Uncharacterized protein n=1 Tax=Liquidambar formosana TaxID=63359 RepID=A0AAP0R6A8_LIQFO
MFSSTIYRNCIFLLCNGILVFLVRNSCLISSSVSSSDYSDEFFKKNGDDLQSESLVTETKELSLDIEVEEQSSGSLENVVVEEGRENEYMIEGEGETANSIAEHEEQKTESGLLITEGTEVVETVTSE